MIYEDMDYIKGYLKHIEKNMKNLHESIEALNAYNKLLLEQLKSVHSQLMQNQHRIQSQLDAIQQNQVQKHDDVTIN